MATHSEILSRGQASRNRHWAGVNARAQVFAILFFLCAAFGAWAGWQLRGLHIWLKSKSRKVGSQ